MTVQEAIEIRDRAISLGLDSCCPQCAEAIDRLRKLGQSNAFTLSPKRPTPTYPQGERVPTLGLGAEDAARWLRRQIGATSVVS